MSGRILADVTETPVVMPDYRPQRTGYLSQRDLQSLDRSMKAFVEYETETIFPAKEPRLRMGPHLGPKVVFGPFQITPEIPQLEKSEGIHMRKMRFEAPIPKIERRKRRWSEE